MISAVLGTEDSLVPRPYELGSGDVQYNSVFPNKAVQVHECTHPIHARNCDVSRQIVW